MISRVMLYDVFFACSCLWVLVFCCMCLNDAFVGYYVMMHVGLCVCYCVYVFVRCVFKYCVCFIVCCCLVCVFMICRGVCVCCLECVGAVCL